MDERAQLNVIAIRDDTIGPHEFLDRSSVTRTQMCSLKEPTAASWSNMSCNGQAAPFKTMWTQYGSSGKLEVSEVLSETQTLRSLGFVLIVAR